MPVLIPVVDFLMGSYQLWLPYFFTENNSDSKRFIRIMFHPSPSQMWKLSFQFAFTTRFFIFSLHKQKSTLQRCNNRIKHLIRFISYRQFGLLNILALGCIMGYFALLFM